MGAVEIMGRVGFDDLLRDSFLLVLCYLPPTSSVIAVTSQIEPRSGATEGEQMMEARMKNPAMVLPDAMGAIQSLYKAMSKGGVPQQTLELVHLRASQINGCSACVYAGVTSAKKAGETDERLFALPAWRESPFFTDAERAALTLTEAATRLSDRGDQVPDEIWNAAADHYTEQELAAIILMIATTNFFNRINATIKEPAGANWG
jgi:AhpD family alkylhydroperoxidase